MLTEYLILEATANGRTVTDLCGDALPTTREGAIKAVAECVDRGVSQVWVLKLPMCEDVTSDILSSAVFEIHADEMPAFIWADPDACRAWNDCKEDAA